MVALLLGADRFRVQRRGETMEMGRIFLGEDVLINPSASLNFVTLGNHSKVGKECFLQGGKNHQLEVGCDCFIGMYAIVDGSSAKITIGRSVTIAQQCVLASDWHIAPGSKLSGLFPVKVAPICIGNNTWVGAGTVIAPGVTIGECCIIGANSYVDCDVPCYSVFGGNPARLIKKLMSNELG